MDKNTFFDLIAYLQMGGYGQDGDLVFYSDDDGETPYDVFGPSFPDSFRLPDRYFAVWCKGFDSFADFVDFLMDSECFDAFKDYWKFYVANGIYVNVFQL